MHELYLGNARMICQIGNVRIAIRRSGRGARTLINGWPQFIATISLSLSLSLYVCIYICNYVCVYICRYIHIYIYIHRSLSLYLYISIYRYMLTHIYIYICIYIYIYVICMLLHIYRQLRRVTDRAHSQRSFDQMLSQYTYIYIYIYIYIGTASSTFRFAYIGTVSSHNSNSQNFNSKVSNPISAYIDLR